MSEARIPVIHDQTLHHFKALPGGDFLDLISTDADNILVKGTDDKLFVPPDALIDPLDLISSDPGNLLIAGTDDKLFTLGCDINPGDLISNQDADNMIELGDDGLLYADRNAPCTVVISTAVSQDAGNILTFGTDGLLYVPTDQCTVEISDLVSKDTNNIIYYGSDGLLKVDPAEECSIDIGALVSADEDNQLTIGSDGLLTLAYPDTLDATFHFTLDAQHDPYIYISLPARDTWAEWRYELRTTNGTDQVGLGVYQVQVNGTFLPISYEIYTNWAAVPAWFATTPSLAFMPVIATGVATEIDILVSLRK
ncbi:MAG: hypothetical protein LBS60_09040 [Deltaproteobacteria bacterium]|jgi:hypothetical protein|nr:hypothetical protein [Deltaproteobacteria bacterium]